MPRLNSRGQAVMGVGNGPLSVDGVQIRADGGGPSVWLNANTVLHQIGDLLHATNVNTGVSHNYGQGVNEAAAAENGQFLAWTNGIGLWGAIVLPFGGLSRVVTDGRGAGSVDTLVYIADRQATSPHIVRRISTGEEYSGIPDRYGLHVLRWGNAVWNESAGTLGFWGTICDYIPGGQYAKLALVNGELWITYFVTGIGFISHRGIDPQVYHVISESENCFHPDVCVVNGKLIVAYSTTTGEGPSHLVKVNDVLTLPSRPYGGTGGIIIPPVNRAVWFGSFDSLADGTFPDNCNLGTASFAMIVGNKGTHVAWYVAGSPDGDAAAIVAAVQAIKDEIAAETREDLPVLAYVPHGVALPANADWIGVECYWKLPLGETLASYESSRKAKVDEAARPCILIAQTYFSNANNAGFVDHTEIQQIVPVMARILRDYSNAIGLLAFSAGSWRATGYDDPALNPLIAPLWEELARSISSPEGGGGGNGGGNGNTGGEMYVEIVDHAETVDRSDPAGLLIFFDITADNPITRIELGLKDQFGNVSEKPFRFSMDPPQEPDDKEGRYLRQIAWKPVINGVFYPYVKIWDTANQMCEQTSNKTVEVTSPF